jgi:WD40 repeat protein
MRLKFSPDASQLVAVSDSYGGVTAVWDVPDRRLKGIVAPGSGSIDFDFDPAGKSVAIVTTYGELYKVENLQQDYRRWKTTRLPGDFGRASIEYTPSGSALLSGLSIYDSAGGDPIFSSSEYNSESYDCLVCTADGQRAFAMYGSLVVCWDLGSGTCSYPFVFHRESTRVKTMDIALSGATLATAAADGIIRLWDINTHRLLVSLKGHQAAVASISFSPDGKKLVSIGYDGLTCFWDTAAYTNGENRDKTLAAPALPTLRKFDVKKGITVKVISEHGASDSEVRRALEAALEQVSN